MRRLVKQTRGLVTDQKQEEAKLLLPTLFKALDKAVKRGVIKKNTASRQKSRLSKLIRGGSATAKTTP